jgi:serine/alanine adding enzyme
MKIVHHLDHDPWKAFVDEHPQGNVFHTPEMFEVYSRGSGYRPSLWAVVENERILALHLPVQITLVGGPFKFLTTRDVDFGGVLAEDSQSGRQALEMLLKTYNRQAPGSPLFTELRNASDQGQIQSVLRACGYQYEDHLNYLIDLRRDEETLLQSFGKSTRSRIRQALKRGNISVKEMTERAELPVFYSVLQKTYRHARIPLADISLFEAAFDVLLPKKMARFTLAEIEGTPVTASVSLLYKDVIYSWYSGSDRTYRSYSPNEFEVWELLSWGSRNGFRIMDFGGAGKPGEKYGVRDFKAKFNGQLVNFGRNSLVHAPFRLKVSKMSYGLARNSVQILHNMLNKFTPKQKSAEPQ